MADAIERPRIFVSSTIQEFRDLRDALKYWLEEMGFQVQLSEYNDFDRKPDEGTFDSCFNNIRASAYYLLLIGGAKGSLYDAKNNVTVTRKEYRTAIQSWETNRNPKVLAVIRKETMVALRERASAGEGAESSSYLPDPKFTSEFVAEVCKTEETEKATKREGPFPASNWLAEFATFRELTDVLRATLNIRGPLQRAAVLENLRHELERNLRLTMFQRKDGTPFFHHYYNTARDEVGINLENYDSEIPLTFEQVKRAHMYVVSGPPRPEVFVRRALSDAILTGVLLEYDPTQDTYEPSELQQILYHLQDELDVYATRYEALDAEIRPAVFQLWDSVREDKSSGDLNGRVLTSLFALHDTEQNIVRITLAILRYLYGHTESVEVSFRPKSPIEGQDQKITEETGSEERLQEWLSEDNALLRMATVDVSPEEKKAAKEGWKAIEEALGEEAAKALLSKLMSGMSAAAADEVRHTIAKIVATDPTALEAFRRVAQVKTACEN